MLSAGNGGGRAVWEGCLETDEDGDAVWLRHWGLYSDPFTGNGSTFVALASHEEAVARLLYAIETRQRCATLRAERGMGKTTVLKKALADAIDPRRRIVFFDCPRDELLLLTGIAERLGHGSAARRARDRPAAWRVLDRALRLWAVQGVQVVLAIDSCEAAADESMIHALERLPLLGDGGAVTVLKAGCSGARVIAGASDEWPPVAGIDLMTRSETERYLTEKLAVAGCTYAAFTGRSVTRLHGISGGVPGVLDRLATLCLMGCAARGMETVTPDVVEGIAPQVWPELRELAG